MKKLYIAILLIETASLYSADGRRSFKRSLSAPPTASAKKQKTAGADICTPCQDPVDLLSQEDFVSQRVELKCGHAFHSGCIALCALNSGSGSFPCPNCRAPATLFQIPIKSAQLFAQQQEREIRGLRRQLEMSERVNTMGSLLRSGRPTTGADFDARLLEVDAQEESEYASDASNASNASTLPVDPDND